MKKILTWVLMLIFIISCSGCNIKGNETDKPNNSQSNPVVEDDSLIFIQSNGTLSKPYENFLWAEAWSEHGWISGDGISISHSFPEIQNELPSITYHDDFQIHYGEGIIFLSLSVYSSDFEIIHHNANQEALQNLAAGTYYLIINVKQQGNYIEAEEKYAYTGYECAYKLIVTEDVAT